MKHFIGFNPLKLEEVVRAEERGILGTDIAKDILEGLLANHDHKENCDCYKFTVKIKEWKEEQSYTDLQTPKESLREDFEYDNYVDSITER